MKRMFAFYKSVPEGDLHLLIFNNEKASTVAIQGMLKVMWIDEYLKWNATNGPYKGINEIFVPRWRIWRPHVAVQNSIGASYPFRVNRFRLRSYGLVKLWYKSSINISCHMDVYNYPFDKQTCEIWIGVPRYEPKEVIVSTSTANIMCKLGGKMPAVNGWRLVSVSGLRYYVYFSVDSKSFVMYEKPRPETDTETAGVSFGTFLFATMELERYNPYFISTMLIPALFATSLNLVSFMINSFELSIGFLLINFILQTVFTLDAAFSIPQTIAMDVVPSLLRYYGFNFVMTVSTFLLFIFVHHSTVFIQTWLAESSTINSVANSGLLTKIVDLLPRDNLRLDHLTQDYVVHHAEGGDRGYQTQTLLHNLKMFGLLVSLIVHLVVATCFAL